MPEAPSAGPRARRRRVWVELDCGNGGEADARQIAGSRCLPGRFWRGIRLWKAWRSRSLGAGVYQPEDAWEVRDRLLEGDKEKRIFIAAVRKQRLAEDDVSGVFGVELDCGKLWRSRLP